MRAGTPFVLPSSATGGSHLGNPGIYQELRQGVVSPASKEMYLQVVDRGREDRADGAIFCCMEGGLLVSASDFDMPVFDSTALHAKAAIDFALGS